MGHGNEKEFSELLGKTLVSIEHSDADDKIIFTTDDGTRYLMFHEHDCGENVFIEDICGDLSDLLGSPILQAEESENSEEHPSDTDTRTTIENSFTWTFYKLATIKANVTIRWFGESNGYYSESVNFELIENN